MFGQVIIGLAGSGKSTYCKVMKEYLEKEGRKVKLVNLDPGVADLTYECDIDIRSILYVEEVMSQENLGPNESMIFSMKFLLDNITWLETELSKLSNDSYLLIDLPGQIELYFNDNSIKQILSYFTNPKGLNYKFTTVFLSDSFYCQSPGSYIQILFTILMSMLNLGLPHVNVFSKSSLLSRKRLPFSVESFTEVNHLEYLVDLIKQNKSVKYAKYYEKVVDDIIDLPWLSFSMLDSKDEESIKNVISQIDMANGYVVSQKFQNIIDEKHLEAERQLDEASDEFVRKFF